jgi:hypothetical protein
MARSKQYNEQQVVEKQCLCSMKWYENTSVRMLKRKWESTSFRFMLVLATNKGYFLESLKCYKSKVNGMFEKFKMEQME